MKIFLPLVTWIVLLSSTVHSQLQQTQQLYKQTQLSPFKTNLKSSRFRNEVFFLNLEDGYFGCQVNESTDYLQLYELSKLCDGNQDCYLGSDELNKELKCTNDCDKDGTQCTNGVCLNGVCHCNDGWGGCNCNNQDENECKYRPCDVFAHCTNTLGSYTCTCFPGYRGDGLHCEDINECQDPQIAARCVENAECCNLPAHFLCKCKDGYEGDGEVLCTDIDECLKPEACGLNAHCINTPGNYTCTCPEGFYGNAYDGCQDIDECSNPNVCGPGAICTNLEGSYRCDCPSGYEGDGRSEAGCIDYDECARSPCGRNAQCQNTDGSFKCLCPDGYSGDPAQGCEGYLTQPPRNCLTEGCVVGECVRQGYDYVCKQDTEKCSADTDCPSEKSCQQSHCTDPCTLRGACGANALCKTVLHRPRCSCPSCFIGRPEVECKPDPKCIDDSTTQSRDPQEQILCAQDADCPDNLQCGAYGQCTDPCQNPQFICRGHKKCETRRHQPVCVCKTGFIVNEFGELTCAPEKRECYRDDDCASNMACTEGKCRNPCIVPVGRSPICAENKSCEVQDHKAVCICMKDCQPSISICLRDAGCPAGLACRNYKCVNPCDFAQCAPNSPCIVEDHKPICKFCPSGFIADSRYGCQKEIGCTSNSECPAQKSCINAVCTDPCSLANPCGPQQECKVIEHQPVCSRVCECQRKKDCPAGYDCDGCHCQQEGIGRTPVCDHCAPGYRCEPTTGACIRDKIITTTTNTTTLTTTTPQSNTEIDISTVTSKTSTTTSVTTSTSSTTATQKPKTTKKEDDGEIPTVTTTEADIITTTAKSSTTTIEPVESTTVTRTGPPKTYRDGENNITDSTVASTTRASVSSSTTQTPLRGEDVKGPFDYRTTPKMKTTRIDTSNEIDEFNITTLLTTTPKYDSTTFPVIIVTEETKSFENQTTTKTIETEKSTIFPVLIPESTTPTAAPATMAGTTLTTSPETMEPTTTSIPKEIQTPDITTYRPSVEETPSTFKPKIVDDIPTTMYPVITEKITELSEIPGTTTSYDMEVESIVPTTESTLLQIDNKTKITTTTTTEPITTLPSISTTTPTSTLITVINTTCTVHTNCAPNQLCVTGQCRFICRGDGPNENNCVKESPGSPKNPEPCQSNNDCIETEACYMGLCQDPCEFANVCAPTAKCVSKMHRPICSCPAGHEGNPTVKCVPTDKAMECSRDSDCSITEACVNQRCQHPCDVRNPCAQNAVCINTNHAADCSCTDGYEGNGYIGCQPAFKYPPVCQYNEDCPPNKLCDRLNRRCINPCQEDSCGENAECIPTNHGIDCRCLPGYAGNAYVECSVLHGCRSDSECDASQACINGECSSPCSCGAFALCDVVNHRGICKCPPGYAGNPAVACSPPSNPCDPNPCGVNALCELDNGNPICYCPKGLTGNPFKNCIPEGDECSPNPCGPNSGCRMVSNRPICFCLPEYEGQPPRVACKLPSNPCDPSPCGPNTQCTMLSNGFSKCTCLPGYVESPNTIRGCIEPINPCDPNPCGVGAICDSTRNPVCFCPDNKIGNPFRLCEKPSVSIELCKPGPCGRNADCYVSGNREECYCKPGFIGDPYQSCREPPRSVCEPNPCGPNAECMVSGQGQSACVCLDGLSGDPTSLLGCHGYECQIDDDCSLDKACMGFKCHDPCPGACGHGANCRVEQHHPVCSCNAGLTGNPGIFCSALDVPKKHKNPCVPSPCGLNSECKLLNNRAVCSCLPNYLGDPQSGCKAECDINSDCGTSQACINHKCVDPCAGTICGINALCSVQQHTPVCRCLDGFTGDAFRQCIAIGVLRNVTRDPCTPSPCGPQDVCSVYLDGVALCDPCFGPDSQYNPRCRPECVSNSECPFDKACIGSRCLDPCPGSCGHKASCHVYEHNPICQCPPGLYGNPYEQCVVPLADKPAPSPSCAKLQCGANADCKKQSGLLTCICRQGYFGNPFVGCRPECVLNSDCPADRACVNSKCMDVCSGVCGINALCQVVNHGPVCVCPERFIGDAFKSCSRQPQVPQTYLPVDIPRNPCEPSPCGPNSRCRTSPEGYAACSCLPNFRGSPPVCQPECIVSSECPLQQACINQRCADPCPGTCGAAARCKVLNHNPICSCDSGYEGDPFVSCVQVQEQPKEVETTKPENPCLPSPCGPNSICQVKQGRPVCSCVANYIGSPPYCRPECTLNSECPSDKACIQEKCENPCANTCGYNAKCTVISHSAYCSCEDGFEGDAFVGCSKVIQKPQDHVDPCYANPCAENAVCTERNGIARCSCIEPYIGDPYSTGCRPECVYNGECPAQLACIKQHCRDPCAGTCGNNAECSVVNHVPVCSCTQGFIGDPFTGCKRDIQIKPISPCEPNVCGPYSICRVVDGRPTCSCQVNYFGAPPQCRPECVVSSECSQHLACINQKCVDPCANTCGFNAKCQVVNHNPICSCPVEMTGDPFEQCLPKPTGPSRDVNACIPSPCGPNSECREVDNRAACSCLPGMFGAPPSCRPECVIHQDCPSNRACIGQRCEDPCIGACGFNALCQSQNHKPICSCLEGHEGDPYAGCSMRAIVVPDIPSDPCYPSPCGSNALCKERNGAGACSCLPNYFGDPYVNCRPECVQNSDCPRTKSCMNMKCVDPCVNLCGFNAVCRVTNHQPVCSCEPGFTGNPMRICHEKPSNMYLPIPKDPCRPSPCGLFSSCRVQGNRPVCSCLPNYMGQPPNCKPECVISAECASDKACINQRCQDPCPGTCGHNARCRVTNHAPICSCTQGYTGDPFQQCVPERKEPARPRDPIAKPNPCLPSPCGPNSQCIVAATGAVCSCVRNYIGRPPNCRPECSINSECTSQMACSNNRCVDPCIGSCGNNALCHVSNHAPVCMCQPGFTGDPFSGCYLLIQIPDEPVEPCHPSPCGLNAICEERNRAASCKCIPEYFGDPYVECRPECVLNSDCPKSRACVNNKCVDPCPGVCGHLAECFVLNHQPNCECLLGYTGNPNLGCHLIPEIPKYDIVVPDNPCVPTPCGLYSNCREQNGHAVCSCLAQYIGAPPNCRPECMSSSDCSQDRSCINERCKDPCPGTCGNNALCRVVNHNPICSCMSGFTGDPFVRCVYEEKRPIIRDPVNPCVPSPCGPNSQCRVSTANEQAVCSCLPNYIGRSPNCRPECTSNSECRGNMACINQRCQDPCQGSCGSFTTCIVNNHNPVCRCIEGYIGDPFSECSPQIIVPPEKAEPCNPSPCGANAICKERNGVGSCTCLAEYNGDPYTECRPECVLNTDCAKNRACINNKCKDPCPGVCGVDAECHVINHSPSCSCPSGYTGNPSQYCRKEIKQLDTVKPCRPSPCGPYSQCREVNDHAVCSCITNYIGSPPACRPECSVSSECSQDRACSNLRCVDPCPGTCGNEAICKVTNHNPICSCPPGFTGDPFVRCVKVEERRIEKDRPTNPCLPSPCGPNSQCRVVGETPVCSCLPNFVGRAPNCRPECTINSECPANLACINERCKDPCPGSCGFNAFCNVVNHSPVCTCDAGYAGDPFAGCNPTPVPEERLNPCNPTPCGTNAECKERNGAGSCTCLENYFGDPYSGCRPECVVNSDCPRDKSCVNQKCSDPCPGVCGINAECRVGNHVPTCLCLPGYTGNPLSSCRVIPEPEPTPILKDVNPCQPSPCGPYSQCREVNGHAVCSCQSNFIGSAPNCRPECIVSSDCAQNMACQNQKCVDPCPGTCGIEARCQVINHYAACSCPPGFTGDPFNRCTRIKLDVPPVSKTGNPCVPSPCGPNSKCIDVGDSPACSCLPNYLGRPPNCRPECMSSSDCPANLACMNQKCSNPCVGACGVHTICTVIKHNPTCQCEPSYTGDPFSGCSVVKIITPIERPREPCNPSPCGANAICRERNGAGSCACLPEYFGDPYSGCRPECVQNSDCDRSKACLNNKCIDPCPGACGINAECRVLNHAPNCQCFEGYTGDPHRSCAVTEVSTVAPLNPCYPSPCGPYSECRESNGHAVCSCLDNYIGAPPSCRPECVVSSECPQNRACIQQKCADPCAGSCGSQARCQVVNHNPICTCPAGMTGDPFVECIIAREAPRDPENPCVPSPCGPNSLCREINGQAACSCQTSYVGRPPNCRPECTNHDECPNHLSCQNEKCIDPCPGSCGNNAMCKVVQHNAICSCSDGYEGDPISGCQLIAPVLPKQPQSSPCEPSPCGPHAECRERNGAGACYCHEGYEGNAYDVERGCRRECESNDECSPLQSCSRFKCVDPCVNICGEFAICSVDNHVPTCTCPPGYSGDPFFQCKQIPVTPRPIINPCVPSPCGPNSICRNINDQAVCSCQSGFINQPPNCRPECVVSSECATEKACVNNKCVDPCQHTCGALAICTVRNHSPICTCPRGMTGDPFVKCSRIPIVIEDKPSTEKPPSCVPSPCGPNSKCQIIGGSPACSCLQDFIGAPPNCRPECVLNSECGPTEACINQKCSDPCPGSCGFEAKCHVLNHVPICNCLDGYTGDPFIRCSPVPVVEEPKTPNDPCDPNPCGPNADCFNGECRCQDNYQGNPYDSCRPECSLSADCPRDKACMRNKCVDPCPGTCGVNALCEVLNHIPVCSCVKGYEGDPFTNCRLKIEEPEKPAQPCSPSPCGSNSQCRDINDHAVCSCLDGFIGAPPQCRPECVVSSECSALQACVNKKCVDPCAGSCGIDARCEVINHSPICGCPPGKTGDPFKRCLDIQIPTPRDPEVPRDPCVPSPCGPNSICKAGPSGPSCQCLPEFFGSPPNCRPECIINPDCPSTQACINNKCRDPCPGSCGTNAECRVISHSVSCSCPTGFAGNAFVQCIQQREEPVKPCEPSPCGSNAECIERNGAASCKCIDEYQGNPYEGCRPECVLSSDCSSDKACIRNKCKDPCPGICGSNAQCYAVNHVPNCVCIEGYTGDPFSNCRPQPKQPPPTPGNPCQPSPCGPNSKCREANGLAVCSCLDSFIGSPPNCKPECTVNAECPQNKACHKFKCANPCAGTCGIDAKCEVINHNPICSCALDMIGDPFTRCYPAPIQPKDEPTKPKNPCLPSPCGLYSECRVSGDQPSCSCMPNYVGAPPNCRPECVVNTDCPSDLACIAEKCRNPCDGTCGINSECRIQNHLAICTCPSGFTGDPFSQCVEIIEEKPQTPLETDPCAIQPCGSNAECQPGGICVCLRDYQGDPYVGCRPECTLSTDCSPNKACLNKKCVDPCPGTCGQNAQCDVNNHIPICTCPKGYTGDPFINCRQVVRNEEVPTDPCQPNPCGPNSICQVSTTGLRCACQPGMLGSPPGCKPECIVSSECNLQTACINRKCVDPCPGSCGQFAKCHVINHNPICTCNNGYTGDPFTRCYQEPKVVEPSLNPCVPSPCGPNSECKVVGDSPACSCAATFLGTPPNCRPECTINPECPATKACIRQKCEDPCVGSCGFNARCSVANHMPICSCEVGYIGDPFTSCQPIPVLPPQYEEPKNPCRPSPCGSNAECRVRGSGFSCDCVNDYIGNPYEGCRPECVGNSECPANRACIRQKCADPCPGTCGTEAICTINNHIPICSCPTGYTGNAFVQCSPVTVKEIPLGKTDPCYPTPCAQNTICKVQRGQAVCECLPGFFGNPFGQECRPECTLSSDCAKNKACVNNKCVDPCPGVCGYGAVCQTVNHNPICSCPTTMIGNPFVECHEAPKQLEPVDPCNPSPCRSNGICRVINGEATCSYPECIVNEDCYRDRTCVNQKCRDPCINACGVNAICNAINHKAICTCPPGFYGSPYSQCLQQMDVVPAPKPECTSDSDCSNDKACVNQQCKNPCELDNICGQNARCHVQLHRPLCVCNEGFTGNAFSNCYLIGCRSDDECPATEACINKQCTDPCLYTQCGSQAVCRSDYNHKARCHCPDGYRGNPLERCERPECMRDDECAFNLACRNEHCEDPCNCGIGAQCRVNNHQAQCRCPPGYVGNPAVRCDIEEVKVAPQCTMDADCSSKLACFSGECKNPCIVTKPCGANAVCSVVDTLPLRTMICECEPGFVGDADVGCRKEPVRDQGCQSNDQCPSTEACRNGNCVNPCIDSSPCARSAECLAQQHRAVCTCPQGTQGDPFVNCYQPPQITAGCTHDSECAPNTACINKQCQDPCAEGNPCAGNAECRVSNNRPICSCPTGWGGDPQVQCFKPECKINADCPYDKACINENCVNPCTYGNVRCGSNALCEPQNHQAVCVCPSGTQGNPFVSCITGHCQYNEDCADHEACDRLNRICRPVCDEDTCAVNAICLARHHQPQCQCNAGYTGNPYQECMMPKQPPSLIPKPECTQDADCSSQLACMNQRCANPCATPHVCTPQQTCTVLDTLPLRTMICKCPSDTITDASGNCVPVRHDIVTGCQHNEECANSEVCQRGSCIDACRLERCGVNAQCLSKDHYAQCTCPKGYGGNPRVECRFVAIEEPKTPTAECNNNDDCPYDKTCRNERCVNPCVEDPCGHGAYCHVQQREAVCRCPAGYTGNAKHACVPPRDVITVGCKSNSDCQLTESCVNDQCINPCNCGPNAECQVRNHHPICYCKSGFSGNAQYGCVQIGCQSDDECSSDQQCINRECTNPCLISDPCALNAECYGRNHRSTCRCPVGMQGDPFVRCIRVECNSDYDCSSNQACVNNLCINPCRDQDNPCAQNALCQSLQHRAVCRCPDHMPLGNPYAYCESRPQEPVCKDDGDCPSGLACIDVKCQNPCIELSPCASSAQCSVLDSVPVRTMVCECPVSYVPDARGECKQVILQSPPGCTSDSDCSDQEACINRQCRNPCNCGTNALCQVTNHRAICSCQDGFEGNPYTLCRSIGCRVDGECDSGKACVNGNCISPCLVNDPCGINAECYVQSNRAQCRCKSGFRGNAYERCRVIGCQSNNDCPSDKFCQNEQCVNPCVYQNTCSPRAECRAHNHLAVCRCPAGFLGNPYVDCRPEPQPTCRLDIECPFRLACINNECVDPCLVLEPCNRPAQCEVTPTSPVRTMICICPEGYISSGSGTCKPTKTVIEVGGCVADSDCPTDKSCLNSVCRDPCNCGVNAECRIKDHKPVCTCRQGYEGNPEFECSKVECSINSDCPSTHTCRNQLCVPACQGEQCGLNAQCLAVDHRAVCECNPGFKGNARISCTPLGCRSDDECPSDKACVNGKCENPCHTKASCAIDEVCKVYQHRPQCACPPGTIARRNGCEPLRDIPICQYDGDCQSQTACIRGECVNPCNATQPCGVNAQCRVLDTVPVRTMICECLEGYTGNAAVQCDKRSLCVIEKGFVRDIDGQCVCPPGTALDVYEYCTPCLPEQGFKIDETGHCMCALEKGFVIDERGRCICPTDNGYRITNSGECVPEDKPECETNDDCADNRYCHTETKTCEDPCLLKTCGVNAFCNAINHRAQCQCIAGYSGNPDLICNHTNFRTDFPRPDMVVSCLADGVQVEIHITEPGFNGVLYVKGHSKDEECRRVVNLSGETVPRTEVFRVHFGSCGMQAVKDIASFVLVIQKHPKLVTYKAQAYNIKCVYQTGEKNVTLGFNVSMLTTAGTIANTGPPPICQMRIITHEGEEINSAEIGDNLKLQVDVEPATIYGGFARSCIAKTMEDNVENEYIVTDENGCATDPTIFGEWDYNPDTNSLLANFNAFKFPSSDNIRFQCNIRVCFGKCQPVNCRGYNAFGRRRRRAIADNSTDDATAIATNTGVEGQLREEITISSNAILTFEKRSTTGANDANIKPAAQRVEDICVSMVGLIIALVITALLALVAVAVAVSCWLMAYRRRPKTLAPLPHPPEFPNPLFTNPEAVPEPTPDYLS